MNYRFLNHVLTPLGSDFFNSSRRSRPDELVLTYDQWAATCSACTRFYDLPAYETSLDSHQSQDILQALRKALIVTAPAPTPKPKQRAAKPVMADYKGALPPEPRTAVPNVGPKPLSELERDVSLKVVEWLSTYGRRGFLVAKRIMPG